MTTDRRPFAAPASSCTCKPLHLHLHVPATAMQEEGGSWALWNKRKAEREQWERENTGIAGRLGQQPPAHVPWADRWGETGDEPLQYLRNLPESLDEDPPADLNLGPMELNPDKCLQAFNESLREIVKWEVDREYLDKRKSCWEMEVPDDEPEDWMFLVDENLQSFQCFNRWYDVITGDLNCDRDAMAMFQKLLRTNPPEAPVGYLEGNKILYHIFKDKYLQGDETPHDWRNNNFSGYLKNSAREAIQALQDPANVKALIKTPTRAERARGTYARPEWQEPGEPARGSNDPPPDPASKGKGKGKGKGCGLRGGIHGKGVGKYA